MRSCLNRLTACALALLTLAGPAQALPEDKDQPIRIEADEALRDEKQGFTRYQGNVKLDQGSLHMEAEQVTVYHLGDDAKKVVAEGRPAIMRQQPAVDKAVVNARARIIEYFRDEERVQLRQAARVDQEGTIVSGDVIDYYIREELIKVGRNKNDESSRVRVVIPAQRLQTLDSAGSGRSGSTVQGVAEDPNRPGSEDDASAAAADLNRPGSEDDAQAGTADPNQPEGDDGAITGT